jgi:hypothetical protein
MYEFIHLLAPHLTKRQVQLAERAESQETLDKSMADVSIPFRRL